MEWWWNDPERGELTRWWSIDPQTGQPNGAAELADGDCHALGDCPLDAAGEAAEAIDIAFGHRGAFLTRRPVRYSLIESSLPPSAAGQKTRTNSWS